MKILAIDIGTYSIKFYETMLERRRIKIIDCQEILLSEYSNDIKILTSVDKIQHQILHDYFKDIDFDGKLIFQLPNRHITTRYLDIPVVNKKKAEMMVGFLLEESIPFSLSKIHFSKNLIKNKTSTEATVYITPRDQFETYLGQLESAECLPNYLTSEHSIIESWTKEKDIVGPAAVMDIGHNTTKVYFILNHRVISNHISHIAGKQIDDVIAHTYQIPHDEAVIYKHDNCFFLTEDQYDQVNESQKEFGLLMKKTLTPLINDFKRWELGARLNKHASINKIYLIGGTSQIRNIENFLTESLNTKVQKVDFFNSATIGEENLSAADKVGYSLVSQMTFALVNKKYPVNFLTGEYSIRGSDNIPLHSVAFVGIRTFLLSACASLLLLINIFLLQAEEKNLDKKINDLIKSPTLGMSNTDKRSFRKDPTSVLKALKKKHIELGREMGTLIAAEKINAANALKELSKKLGRNKEVDVVFFENINQGTKVLFESKDINSLKTVLSRIKTFNLPNSKTSYKEGDKSFELTYNGL